MRRRELLAMYTMGQLGEMSGLDSRTVQNLLLANGVPLRPHGSGTRRKRMVVMLSDLKDAFPEFWESCEERAALFRRKD